MNNVNGVKESSRKKRGLPPIHSKADLHAMVPNTAGTQKYELCLSIPLS